jgi:CIC family chloride channel protein
VEHQQHCPVEEKGKVIGVLERNAIFEALVERSSAVEIGEIADRNFRLVNETATLLELISAMHSKQTGVVTVADKQDPISPRDVKGLISKERIADSMAESVDLFAR